MRRIVYLTLAITATLVFLVACSSNKQTSAQPNPAVLQAAARPAPRSNGERGSLKIGSKPFAEEQLLATMTKLVLEKNGFKVDFTTQAADPAIDQALRCGSIDMLWQYTGTELQQFLKVDQPPTDLDEAFEDGEADGRGQRACAGSRRRR